MRWVDIGPTFGGELMRVKMAIVPTAGGEVPTGTLRAILGQLGLRPEDLR